jgi:hypothetical protein
MRFYTYAPIDYPYIMRNIKQKPRKNYKHEIVDIGIYDLLKSDRHSDKKINKWKNLKTDGWKVVPDCPDLVGEFGKKTDVDNVEYSKQLLMDLFNPEDPSQLPVIQGYYDNYGSFVEFITWFKKEYGPHDKIAVGTMCKSGNRDFVKHALHYLRKQFPESFIHAFGLRLYHLKNVFAIIDSFDSMSWKFPRIGGLGKASAKTHEFELYFQEYLKRIEITTHHQLKFNSDEFLIRSRPLQEFFI